MRSIRFALCLIMLTALLPGSALVVSAQAPDGTGDTGDTGNTVEQAALRAHLQNLRTHSYTDWIGGPLGNADYAPLFTALGDTLDRWRLSGIAGDDDLHPDDLTRPTLLNFWASWCYPCRLEFPHLSDAALNPDQHAFDIVFVNIWDTSQSDAENFLDLYSSDLHTVIDPDDRLARRASIPSIPTSLLIDSDGTVLAVHIGLITPTIIDFLDAVSDHPGEGSFVAADYADRVPQADLLPVDLVDAAPITFGEPATGIITAYHTQDAYQFEGHAGDEITIRLSAPGLSELDSYVALLTTDGERIAENDDIDPGIIQDSYMTVTLPDDGTYIVVATRFLEGEGFSEGIYELIIEREGEAEAEQVVTEDEQHPPATGEIARGTTIAYGDTVTGTITNTDYEQAWTFTGTQGDVITATMNRADKDNAEPGGLDGYLMLIGPNSDTLVEADDSTSVMPVIDGYELPSDGPYTLIATRFALANGLSEGAYTLTLDRHTTAPVVTTEAGEPNTAVNWLPDEALPDDLRWITYNEPITGALDNAQFEAWYIFQGTAGDVLTIHMTATDSDLDPFLLLTDEKGYELARNDDASGDTSDAAIATVTLPASGPYLIRATRYGLENGPSQGTYTLIIETDADSAPVEAASIPITDIALSDVVTSRLDLERARARYTFTAAAGDWVTISVQTMTGDLDPALTLYDPDGAPLATSHGWHADDREARLSRIELPAEGTYQVEVHLDNLTTSGSYQLIVLPAAPVAVDPGAFVPAEGLDVEIVLIWDSEVDLDLSVPADPAIMGEQIVHSNDFCADTMPTPIERFTKNIESTWRETYTVHITYHLNCTGQSEPVNFILVIAHNGEVVDLIGGTLAREGDTYTTRLSIAP